jgi:hypothetical protein
VGASAKTLSRFADLHARGLLPASAAVIELGAQELYCSGQDDYVREVLRFFTDRNPALRPAADYTGDEIAAIAGRGMFSRMVKACGFSYLALDIFDADDTALFDLNLQDPGPELVGRFDLVTNFGTTEHVINQFRSMQTMHDLARPGGLLYHDLPFSGYHNHGYFSYNPLLFQHLADANGYEILMQHYSRAAAPTPAPSFMIDNGYPEPHYFDAGIEFIFRKTADAPFRMPLETSTSLRVNGALWGADNPYAPVGAPVAAPSAPPDHGTTDLSRVPGRTLQKELLNRYAGRLRRALGLG